MEKRITSIKVDNQNAPINSKGETRAIKIHGTQGSGFSLEINDSSGHCILEEPLKDIEVPRSGVYILNQAFPDISTNATGGLIEETYEIKITPHADVQTSIDLDVFLKPFEKQIKELEDFYKKYPYNFDGVEETEEIKELKNLSEKDIPEFFKGFQLPNMPKYEGVDPITLYQYADPTITLATSVPTEVSTTVSGSSDITATRPAFSKSSVSTTQTLTIAEGEDIAGFYYVKDNFKNSISKNTSFERVVTTSEEPKLGSYLILKPSTLTSVGSTTSGTVTKGGQDYPINSDIKEGMSISGTLTKTKIVHKSLDVKTCQRATDRFELSDTVGLIPDMICEVFGLGKFLLESVECGKNIKINKKVVIPEDTSITFKYITSSTVSEVKTQINEDGNACVDLTNPIMIIDGMTFTFDEDNSKINSSFVFNGSGTNTVVIKNIIKFSNFGKRDVTYTLDLNNIITRTPNALDYNVEVPKNSTNFSIKTTEGDIDRSTKTAAKTSEPRNGTASISGRTFSYTPNPDFVGNDRILYTLSDGTNTSAEKIIYITVK
jgi:hypothetical protein|tara:strand:- start:3424 stop:5067 length:1644 start_codon:yes stop_codon:yes gene_type:complete